MANADTTSSTPRARKGRGSSSQNDIDDVRLVKEHIYAGIDEVFDLRALGNSAAALLDREIDKEDQENISCLVNMILGSVGNILVCLNGAEEELFKLKGGAA